MSDLYVRVLAPEDVVRHLGSPTHWKRGYSAQELVCSWVAAKGLPSRVKLCLQSDSVFREAQLLDGFLERRTDLGSRGAPSQTDLLAFVDLGRELGLIAIEGKVEESFDRLVKDWNDGSVGKIARLRSLCSTLHLADSACSDLRYQLLHRTVAALREARRYHIRHAMVLVHSFSATSKWFEDFQSFASVIGCPLLKTNTCSIAKNFDGVTLRLAWIADVIRADEELINEH